MFSSSNYIVQIQSKLIIFLTKDKPLAHLLQCFFFFFHNMYLKYLRLVLHDAGKYHSIPDAAA